MNIVARITYLLFDESSAFYKTPSVIQKESLIRWLLQLFLSLSLGKTTNRVKISKIEAR